MVLVGTGRLEPGQIVVGGTALRIDSEGLAVVLDRFVVLSLRGPNTSTIGKGVGIGRIEPDRLAIVFQRTVVVALFAAALARSA